MKISIVIPTHNGMPLFRDVLDAIERQESTVPFDLYCVDTASSDGTWEEIVRRDIPRHQIPKSEFDHGATRADAIRRTTGELVVQTVQDATPHPGWLAGMVDALTTNAAAAYSRQVPYHDVSPFLALRLSRWSAGRDEPRVQRLLPGESLDQFAPLDRLRLCAFDDVSSMVRRDVWERHVPSRRKFGEDVAFAKNLIEAGETIVYAPSSVVTHSHNDGALAEFKRIYMDHANLHDLFGILTVPTFKDAWRNSNAQFGVYRDMVDELDPPEGKREELLRFGRHYAFAETFGQWLGARSLRKAPPRGVFALLDRWITG